MLPFKIKNKNYKKHQSNPENKGIFSGISIIFNFTETKRNKKN